MNLERKPLTPYRGTSLIRNHPPLGPYSRPVPRVLRWFWGGGGGLMSEVPLYQIDSSQLSDAPVVELCSGSEAGSYISEAHRLLYHSTQIDAKLLTLLSSNARGDLSPMAAVLGGIVAQEVLKGCSGKFMPINQWLMYDNTECLPEEPLPEGEYLLKGSRYDGQIAVFGNAFQEKLLGLNYFLVGAGAIGSTSLTHTHTHSLSLTHTHTHTLSLSHSHTQVALHLPS